MSLYLVPRQIQTLPHPQLPSAPGASLVPVPPWSPGRPLSLPILLTALLPQVSPYLPPTCRGQAGCWVPPPSRWPTFLKVEWNRSLLPEHSAALGKLQSPLSNVMPVGTTVGSELPRGQRQKGKNPHGREAGCKVAETKSENPNEISTKTRCTKYLSATFSQAG